MDLKDFGITNESLAPGETAFLGQHVYCVGDRQGDIKIIVDPLDRDIPKSLQADGFHRPFKPSLLAYVALPESEKAAYGPDGKVVRAGYLPGGLYVTLDGTVTNTGEMQGAINDVLNASLRLGRVAGKR